jgi:hypothetical protein
MDYQLSGPWIPLMKGQDGRNTNDQWTRSGPRVETTRPEKL